MPCVEAALIIAGRASVVSRLLSCAALVWIGALSYSLYLWHWLVLAGLRYFLGTYQVSGGAIAVFVLLTTVLSGLSSRYVELSLRSTAVPGKPTRRAVLLVVALATMIIV